jgi:hypothetical protein
VFGFKGLEVKASNLRAFGKNETVGTAAALP